MKLFEILNESINSERAIAQLIRNTDAIYVLYTDTLTYLLKDNYARGEHEDIKRMCTKLIKMRKGKFFADNYLSTSSRRMTPTSGFKSALEVLSQDPKLQNCKSDIKQILSMPIFASSALRQEHEAGFSGLLDNLTDMLPPLLTKMSSSYSGELSGRLKFTANRLITSVNKFNELWTKLQSDWDKDWGEHANQPEPTKKEPNNLGSQNSQVDMIVNQVLSSLDKKIANDIRIKLARSDNKLMTLQQELNSRGIKM